MPPRKKQVKEIVSNAPSEIDAPVNPLEDGPAPIVTSAPVADPPKQKRERKSKKYDVVAVITPDGIQGSLQTEPRMKPLIACLPINSSEVLFHDQPLQYDPTVPTVPVAFDASELDPFSAEAMYEFQPDSKDLPVPSLEQVLQHKQTTNGVGSADSYLKQNLSDRDSKKNPLIQLSSQQPSQQQMQPQPQQRKKYGPTQLLTQFAGTKQTKELPSSVDIACFWCCEGFSERPCVIPTGFHDGVWHVYGNFCSPQCSLAYLLSEFVDTHIRWERIAMLHRLYGAQCNGRIYPAPSRESLQRFGGAISAQEFREMIDSQRLRVDIQMPPMVSILASMDTKPIDFYETTVQTKLTSTSANNPLFKVDETGLKLRRSKPLKDRESTLDSCLQIQVKAK